MPFTLRSTNPQPTTRLWSGLILFALAIGTPLLIEQTILRVLAGSVLYFLLPGYFLNLALLPEQGWLERITLAIGVSTALSTISVLAIELVVPGLLTFVQIWSGLGALSLCAFAIALYAAWQHPGTTSSDPPDPTNKAHNRWWWLAFLLILLLAAALRLAYLNHAELQDDEIDIANVAVRILSGEAEVVFRDRRGPAQTVITAAAYLIGGRPSEWILRLPAVITALATIVGLVALSSRLFNRWIGLVSGLLFSLEGFVFAYGRIVQMQSTLIFMMVATVLCFYNLYRSHSPRDARIYQALGTLFFSFGLLAHYEMALLAPLLLFVYFAKYGRSFWQQDKGGLLVALSILLLTAGAFYLAFILNPAFDETLTYYRDDIVGRAINNSSVQFFLVGLFYNSIYLFGALYLGAAIAIGVQLRLFFVKHKVAKVVLLLLCIVVAIGVLLTLSSAILRSGTQFNGLLLSVALVIAAFCILSPRLPFSTRLLFLWFALYFIAYLFLLREVHIHYYAFSPPLAILAAWGWSELYQRGAQRAESAAAGRAAGRAKNLSGGMGGGIRSPGHPFCLLSAAGLCTTHA